MGGRPSGMQIGAAKHILLYARIMSLNFLEKARPCLLFFSAIYLPSLIKDTECICPCINSEICRVHGSALFSGCRTRWETIKWTCDEEMVLGHIGA